MDTSTQWRHHSFRDDTPFADDAVLAMAHVRRELGPSTEVTLRQLGARGQRTVIVVPIAFTSDHIETLSELDIAYAHVAKIAGVTNFIRAGALNDEPVRTASRNSLPVASMV